MGQEIMARVRAGPNRHLMHSERNDGHNALAVNDAVQR